MNKGSDVIIFIIRKMIIIMRDEPSLVSSGMRTVTLHATINSTTLLYGTQMPV